MPDYTIDPSGLLVADFESVQEFEDVYVDDGALYQGTFIDDTPDEVSATFNTAAPIEPPLVNCSPSVRHAGTATSGARMLQTTGNQQCVNVTSTSAATFEDLIFEISGNSTGTCFAMFTSAGMVTRVNRCILSYDSTGSSGQTWVFSASSYFYGFNTFFQHTAGATPFGFNLFNGNEHFDIRNCTFLDVATNGFLCGGLGGSVVGNTIVLSTTGSQCYAFIAALGNGYNMGSDATAPGAVVWDNEVAADILADTVGPVLDLHWISRAVGLTFTGDDQTATIGTLDIDNETRVISPSAENMIGADYDADASGYKYSPLRCGILNNVIVSRGT